MFSKNLKYLRHLNKLSQHQLSELLGYNQATITRWENEERKPTLEAIVKIAEVFKVDIGDLLTVNIELNKNPINKIIMQNNIEVKIRGRVSKESIDKVNEILIKELNKQSIQE